ncbi:MAG: BatA domain-containing protein, partial [Cyclobacteriaceae bacterium]
MSIPILIHLLDFQKAKKIFFTNVRLLEEVKLQTASKRNLKYYLILLSRCLFILFLVLAFTQPFIPSSKPTSFIQNNSLYIDNSLSMENKPFSELSALEEAKQLAIQLANELPTYCSTTLLTNTNNSHYSSKEALIEAISSISFTSKQIDSKQLIKKNKDKQFFFFSDFQRYAFSNWKELKGDSLTNYQLIPMNQGKQANNYIDSVWINNSSKQGNKQLNVLIKSIHSEETKKVVVKLTKENILIGSTTIDLNTSHKLSFDIQPNDKIIEGTISINDYPVQFDDVFHFTIPVKKKENVVIVSKSKTSFIHTLYSDTNEFITIQKTYPVFTTEELNETSLIIIDQQAIPTAIEGKLVSFTKNGGNLLLIPSENTPLNYLSNRIKLISVANSSKKQVPLEISDFNNPFFNAIFEKKNSLLNTPQAKKGYKPSSFNYSILQFPDGDPFLYYNALGKGKVFVFTTPLDKKYTDLSNHALCVPIFYTMAIQTNASS